MINKNQIRKGFFYLLVLVLAMLITSIWACKASAQDAQFTVADSIGISNAVGENFAAHSMSAVYALPHPDSVVYQPKNLTCEQAIAMISKDLRKSQKEYRAGWIASASGAGLMILSSSINSKSADQDPHDYSSNPFKPMLMIVGGAFSLAGLVMIIDSHSKIGDAGRFYLSPEGLIYKF